MDGDSLGAAGRFRGRALSLLVILLFVLLPVASQAELVTYPAPSGAPENTTYSVAVRNPGGTWKELFVYDAVVDKSTMSHMGFAYFDSDFSAKVEVKVTRNTAASSVAARPASAGIVPVLEGKTATFSLSSPVKLSIEFDNDLTHNLFLFANPAETTPVAPSDPTTHYFGPGIHYIGDGTGTLYAGSGDTVYIAGGAIVYGNILIHQASDVTVAGRGILSGSLFDHTLPDNAPKPSMLIVSLSSRVSIKDLIILDSPGWNLPIIASDKVTVDNVKVIAWTVNSDGVSPQYSNDVTVNGCLVRTNDDCIAVKLATKDDDPDSPRGLYRTFIQNSILWADQGRAILIGPEAYSTADRTFDGVMTKNIDVLGVNNYNLDWAKGVVAINCADGATVKNVTFQNMRVENISSLTSLFNLTMAATPYNTTPGNLIKGVTFDNVVLKGPNRKTNVLHGIDAARHIDGAAFRNMKIDGTCVTSAAAGDISSNQFVKNVTYFCGTETDKEAPTVPVTLRARVPAASTVLLTWTSSADNVGVTGYRIYRNGLHIGTSYAPFYTDSVALETDATYAISAFDATGNESAQSDPLLVKAAPLGRNEGVTPGSKPGKKGKTIKPRKIIRGL